MKLSKFGKFILVAGAVASVSGCEKKNDKEATPTPTSEPEVLTPVEINSLYDGMVAVYQTKNYSFEISKKEGSKNTSLGTLKFREDYVGYDGSKNTDFHGTINDGHGLFNVSYEDNYITSEYLTKEDSTFATSLWDNSVVSTMYGVGGQFIKKYVTSETSSITVSDKNYVIGFIKTIGYDSLAYSSVKYLKAEFKNNVVTYTLSLGLSVTTIYTIKLINVGITTSTHLKDFKDGGNKVFTPNEDLSEMRRLIKLDNFIHQIYSLDGHSGSYIGYEFMTPHYLMTTGISDTNTGAMYMEIEHTADEEINQDMSGIYLVAVSIQDGQYNFAYSPNPINTTPEIEKCMHYPSFLKLLNGLEYVKAGDLRGAEYLFTTETAAKRYYFTDQVLVYDFAKNFSLTEQFSDCTPLAVAIELDFAHDVDKDKYVVFHYLMKYAGDGETYDVILPLMWFGAANKAHCDNFYNYVNNKNISN